jgi:hypothetical protein
MVKHNGEMIDIAPPVRNFQRFTSEERANLRASFRLGYQQRRSVGEFFWTHPLASGVAFPTRKAAIEAALSRLTLGLS